jgi:hypothetical protein
MGTRVASGLTGSEFDFMLSESEWPRVILESGPVLGVAYLLLRVLIVILLGVSSWRALREDSLPLLLFGASSLVVISGQFGQPTTLGFACLGGGLCLAAAGPAAPAPLESNIRIKALPPQIRGRSKYAETLHGP